MEINSQSDHPVKPIGKKKETREKYGSAVIYC
jgi:hypothetical protein